MAQNFQDKISFTYAPLPFSPYNSWIWFFSHPCNIQKLKAKFKVDYTMATMGFKLVCGCCMSSLCYQQGSTVEI